MPPGHSRRIVSGSPSDSDDPLDVIDEPIAAAAARTTSSSRASGSGRSSSRSSNETAGKAPRGGGATVTKAPTAPASASRPLSRLALSSPTRPEALNLAGSRTAASTEDEFEFPQRSPVKRRRISTSAESSTSSGGNAPHTASHQIAQFHTSKNDDGRSAGSASPTPTAGSHHVGLPHSPPSQPAISDEEEETASPHRRPDPASARKRMFSRIVLSDSEPESDTSRADLHPHAAMARTESNVGSNLTTLTPVSSPAESRRESKGSIAASPAREVEDIAGSPPTGSFEVGKLLTPPPTGEPPQPREGAVRQDSSGAAERKDVFVGQSEDKEMPGDEDPAENQAQKPIAPLVDEGLGDISVTQPSETTVSPEQPADEEPPRLPDQSLPATGNITSDAAAQDEGEGDNLVDDLAQAEIRVTDIVDGSESHPLAASIQAQVDETAAGRSSPRPSADAGDQNIGRPLRESTDQSSPAPRPLLPQTPAEISLTRDSQFERSVQDNSEKVETVQIPHDVSTAADSQLHIDEEGEEEIDDVAMDDAEADNGDADAGSDDTGDIPLSKVPHRVRTPEATSTPAIGTSVIITSAAVPSNQTKKKPGPKPKPKGEKLEKRTSSPSKGGKAPKVEVPVEKKEAKVAAPASKKGSTAKGKKGKAETGGGSTAKASKKGKVESLKTAARGRSASGSETPEVASSPASSDKITGADEAEDDVDEDDAVYCPCGKASRADGNDTLVACDVCDTWFHAGCVFLTEKEIDLVDSFICKDCEKKTGQRTTMKKLCKRPGCGNQFSARQSKFCSSLCAFRHSHALVATLQANKKTFKQISSVLVGYPSPPPEIRIIDHSICAAPPPPTRSHVGILDKLETNILSSQSEIDRLRKRQAIFRMAIERCETLTPLNLANGEDEGKKKRKSGGGGDDRPCGWVERLIWTDTEVDSWRVPSVEAGTDRDGKDVEMRQDESGEGYCAMPRKRCDRHSGWQKTIPLSLDLELALLEIRNKALQEEKDMLLASSMATEAGKRARDDLHERLAIKLAKTI